MASSYPRRGRGKAKAYWNSIVTVDGERTASSILGTPLRSIWFWALLISISFVTWWATGFAFFLWIAASWFLLTINRIADRACPPVVLLLAASDKQSIGRFRRLKNWAGPLRVVCLLDVDTAEQRDSLAMEIEGVGSTLLPDLLRTQSQDDWRRIVRKLMSIVAVIVVDVTRPSAYLGEELRYLGRAGFKQKVRYFSEEPLSSFDTPRAIDTYIDSREVMTMQSLLETLDRDVGDLSSSGVLGRFSSVLMVVAVLAELILICTGVLPLLRVAQALLLRSGRSA